MRKLGSLREHILQRTGVQQEHLLTFTEGGKLTSFRGARNGNFEINYKATVILTDFLGKPEELFFIILEWFHRECPGADPEETVTFAVDVVSAAAVDVELSVKITETVIATERCDGTLLSAPPDADALDIDLFGVLG